MLEAGGWFLVEHLIAFSKAITPSISVSRRYPDFGFGYSVSISIHTAKILKNKSVYE